MRTSHTPAEFSVQTAHLEIPNLDVHLQRQSASSEEDSTKHHRHCAASTAIMAPSFDQLDPETEYEEQDDIDYSGTALAFSLPLSSGA